MKKVNFIIKIIYYNLLLFLCCLAFIQNSAFSQDYVNPYNYNNQTNDQLQFYQFFEGIIRERQQDYYEHIAPYVNAYNVTKNELIRQYNAGLITKEALIKGTNDLQLWYNSSIPSFEQFVEDEASTYRLMRDLGL